jgi:iron complex outermembrane receptor protein
MPCASAVLAQTPEPATSATVQQLSELSLEDLTKIKVATVYAASKREQGVAEAPSSVSIVTAQDIQPYGYRTLGDIINSVRGFYVTGNRSHVYDSLSSFDCDGTGNPGDYTVNYDWARSQSVSVEAQVGKTLFGRHAITAGAEYRDLFSNHCQNEDLFPPVNYTSIKSSQRTWGVFANLEAQLYRTNLTLDAGVRCDGFSAFDPAFNPRAALIAHPWALTTFKLLYGQAYRTPNLYETAYNRTYESAAPPPTPETIRTYGLVWEQELGKHFRSAVSGYWNQAADLIARETDPVSINPRLVNRGEVEGRGVEFEIEGRAKSGLRGRVSYALQETQDTVASVRLSNSPQQMAKLNVAVPNIAWPNCRNSAGTCGSN